MMLDSIKKTMRRFSECVAQLHTMWRQFTYGSALRS
jgi:hypothetical protein